MSFSFYRHLVVWTKGIEFVCACYETTRNFPREELFGLTSQQRRAAIPVATNIAEGHGRGQTGDYIRFRRIATGSMKQAETHLFIANRNGICLETDVTPLLLCADELGRMLRALLAKLEPRL